MILEYTRIRNETFFQALYLSFKRWWDVENKYLYSYDTKHLIITGKCSPFSKLHKNDMYWNVLEP